MSHVVTIQTRIHDPVAVGAACARLGLVTPVQGTVELYSGSATGLIVQLPGWQYPAVIDIITGTVKFDNYEGHWGEQREMDHFLQAYAVERTKQEARKRGYAVSESQLQDGSIKLQIVEGD